MIASCSCCRSVGCTSIMWISCSTISQRWSFSISGFATIRTLLLLLCALLPIFVLFSDLSKIFTSADQHSAQTTHFLEKRTLCLPLPAVYIPETDKYSCLHSNRWEKMPTCCTNCHKLLQRIVVLETKLFAGLPKQTEHSAQSAAEPRTLIVGDSIIRNVSSRTATTCCFPQATVSDVNKELRSIVMKHKTANRVIIHVGKNDIRKRQSEMLKQDFSELFETLQRLEVQSFISGPLPARGTNMFSRLLGLNTWLQRTCSTKGVNFIDNFNIFWGHRQLFKLDGLHPNKLGARVLKDNFYFSLCHPSVVCVNPLTQSPGQNMSDHRTSYQLPSHYVVEESHKDTDNATQPKQTLLMDIPAEPCPQSSSHADCDVSQQLQDSAPKDNFLENSLGCHDNTLQSPETSELEPRSPDTLSLSPAPGQNMPRSPDTLSLSPASPLLSFSQKMEELVYAGTKLSASPQISTKKRRAPQPPKTAGSALPPPPVRALRPLPQRKGPNPPPSAVGEPKTTDNSSQWYVSGPRYTSSNIHKRLQNKREPSVPVAFSISVLSRDRRSKAFKRRTADPSNLRPVMHQSKIAVETKFNSSKLAFLNTRSQKNKSFVINDLITTNNLDFMFLIETWLEDNCSATVLTETAPPNFNFISVCRTVRRGGGVAALFKDVYQCKQVSFGQYLSLNI